MTIELFRCEPLLARISAKQCAENYRASNGYVVRGSSSRAIGLGPCKGCETGKNNSKGWRDPRVKQTIFGTIEERREKGWEIILKRDTPITAVERMAGLPYGYYRARLAREGYDVTEWPHLKSYVVPKSKDLNRLRSRRKKKE